MVEAPLEQDHEWQTRGVDIWMIRDNLRLSYEARIAQHQNTLDTIELLQQMKHRDQLQCKTKKQL